MQQNIQNVDSLVNGDIVVSIEGVGEQKVCDLTNVPVRRVIATVGAVLTGEPFEFSPTSGWEAGYRASDSTIFVRRCR